MRHDDLDDLLQRGYRYALSITHDSDLAQDVLQDACLKLSRQGGPWNIRYLITTIRTCHIDTFRNDKLDLFPLHDADLSISSDMTFPSFDRDLEDALADLNPEARELLYLSVVEGYTAAELASLTDRPRGTILSTLHRARKTLKQQLLREGRDKL